MRQAHEVVIWEPQPYWEPELQRQLGPLRGCVRRGTGLSVPESAGQLVVAGNGTLRVPLTELRRCVQAGLHVHLVLDPPQVALRWFLYEMGAASVLSFSEARHSLGIAVGRLFTNKVI